MVWEQLGAAAIKALPQPRDINAIAPINYNAAQAQLGVGALGVREGHLNGRARTDVISLINAGHVHRLFLECYSEYQDELDNAVGRKSERA